MCAVAGIGAVVYAISLKVPFTWDNRLAWGVPIALTAVGIIFLIANRMDTPSYWDGPDVLRLTSRPIPA